MKLKAFAIAAFCVGFNSLAIAGVMGVLLLLHQDFISVLKAELLFL